MKEYKNNTKAITPKVSVIIPSLNAGPYIDEAISSVRNQTIYEIEIICVDAGSTDGTLEIIKKHMKLYNYLAWDVRYYNRVLLPKEMMQTFYEAT